MPATSTSIRRAQALLGTFVEIDATGATRHDTESAVEAAFAAIADIHRLMSFHDPDSDLSRLNRDASHGPVRVHPWTYTVLEAALEMARQSDGAFDIRVAGTRPSPCDSPAVSAFELLADHHVRFPQAGVKLDLGGIAKGFAVDRAIDVLQNHGVQSALVNAGGDLSAFGVVPRLVALRDPRFPDRILGQIELSNEALASSARRFNPFESKETSDTAVVDPATQLPAHGAHGATVRAPTCMVADALTKVVMVSGEKASAQLIRHQASAMFLSTRGDIHATSDWQGVLHHAA
ncbi:FAD:protein FMN transferase [Bradyrhizobium sp. HKCCYLS2038]|uniref:FAD:protein FMN transferase n=1 Tax=unclassified Bradyrhizobium TaxID=2631580 RepID=UPI003EBF1280